MKNESLVSVVMPSYNSANFIGQSIESVLAQVYEHWELLVVDDASTDNSFDVIEDYAKSDCRIKARKLSKNSGAAIARNWAIDKASGRYIAFLDSDDFWYPDKLLKQIDFMERFNYSFSWTSYDLINAAGRYIRTQTASDSVTYIDLLRKKYVIGCLTAIYDTSKLGKQFMPEVRMRQDYALWLKLLRVSESQGLKTGGMNEVLSKYRIHEFAMTRNKINSARYQWNVYRFVEGISFLRSIRLMCDYLFYAIVDRVEILSQIRK